MVKNFHSGLMMLALSILPLLGQDSVPPEPNAEAASKPPEVVPKGLTAAPKILWDDTLFILKSPAHWKSQDWLQAGEGFAIVLGTALLLDTRMRDESQRHRGADTDRVAKQIQNFGTSYAFMSVAGFWAFGKLAGDSNAVDTGLDALEASLIAGAIIGPLLKTAVGRSRPSEKEGAFHFSPFGGGVSAPSGHTTEAFALAVVIADHYPQVWVRYVTYGIATLVGAARIQQNAHFASDVVSGALLGSLVGGTVLRRNHARRGGPDRLRVALGPSFGPGYQGAQLSVRF
jgi:membrane-associated phospholipid phosphatase